MEDDFSGNRNTSAAPTSAAGYQMNPNHSYGGPTPGFYGGPGPGPGYPPGGPGAYPPPHGAGPMSPYGGGGPMSPYSGQGPPPAGQPAMYGNQNSPFHNQNQSSPYSGPGPGPYPDASTGGFSSMQTYYNNQSPPSHGQHQFQFSGHPGGPAPHHRPLPSPPPLGALPPLAMPYPARIPHPNINSPNQNTHVTGNQIKTENMDLKAGSLYAPPSQGYNQSGFGYNGFGGPGAGQASRPLMSPGGAPNLSPRAPGPPSMSPHQNMGSGGLYSQQQSSPGNTHGQAASQASSFPPPSQHHQSYNTQYEYFSKQGGGGSAQLQHGSPSYPGIKEETYDPHRPPSFPSDERSLSDVQSNASVRSTGDDTPKHSSFGEDSNPTQGTTITNLVNIKKEPSGDATGDNSLTNKPPSDEKQSTGDSDDKKVTPKSEPEEAKPEGSYFEEQKDFTLKANQNIIDNMNLDSIPELPEIPELKYEDMNRSPKEEDEGRGPLGRVTMAEFMKNPGAEEGYHDQWGHMQGEALGCRKC